MLLILVSLFASLCLSYQLFFTLPDLIDAWKIIQESGWEEEFFHPFIKILYALVIQIGFYGSVAFWSGYEATRERTGSVTTTKGLRIVQLAILAILGIFSLKFSFDMLSTWGTQTQKSIIDVIITSSIIIVVLAFLVLIMEMKLKTRDDTDEYMEKGRQATATKTKSAGETQSNLVKIQQASLVISWLILCKILVFNVVLLLSNPSAYWNMGELLTWAGIMMVPLFLVIAIEIKLRKNKPRTKTFKQSYEEQKKRELEDRI